MAESFAQKHLILGK